MTFRPLNGSDMRSCAVPLMHKYQFLNWSFKEIYARTRITSTSAHRPKRSRKFFRIFELRWTYSSSTYERMGHSRPRYSRIHG